ncbi:MAG: hypothetical protein QOI25_5390 [Mycobacterium sp.]|nr:hypothetical protein [Mycobacterium sp.]
MGEYDFVTASNRAVRSTGSQRRTTMSSMSIRSGGATPEIRAFEGCTSMLRVSLSMASKLFGGKLFDTFLAKGPQLGIDPARGCVDPMA